jgi:hypothetical protein
MYCSDGVVVITSALHAEGREFDPRSKYFFFIFFLKNFYKNTWSEGRTRDLLRVRQT